MMTSLPQEKKALIYTHQTSSHLLHTHTGGHLQSGRKCSKAPGLEAAQLKHDACDPGILELDGLRLRFDLSALRSNVCQHAGGQFGSGGRAQADKVFGAELVHAGHACIVQNPHANEN